MERSSFHSRPSPTKRVITHKGSNRSTTYGKVAEAASKLDVHQGIKLKDPKDWTIAGKPLKRKLSTPPTK